MKYFFIKNYIPILFTIFFLIVNIFFLLFSYPYEDALILFRYAKNFSLTNQITFNLNDIPTEGATDFLWLIVLGTFNKFKIDPAISALIINSVSFFIILKFALDKINKDNSVFISLFFSLIFINIGPIICPSIGGFNTLTFCALGLLVYSFANGGKIFSWTLSSILFCLFRPEAVIFFIFSIPLIYFKINKYRKKEFFLSFIIILLVGLFYNLFRFYYFQEIFPLPLIVKNIGGDFSINRYFAIISQVSSTFFISMCIVVFLYLIFYWKKSSNKNSELFIFILLFLASLIYVLLLARGYLSQNIYFRYFSHFYFILFFFSFYCFVKLKNINYINIFCILLLFIGSLNHSNLLNRLMKIEDRITFNPSYKIINQIFSDNLDNPLISISQTLKNYDDDVVIMLTEAGALPLFSNKFSIDMVGLNTSVFAHRTVNCDDFLEIKPDLIEIDVGAIEQFNYGNLIEDPSIPSCGFIQKDKIFNSPKIFNNKDLRLIDNHNFFKSEKHRNATVASAAINTMFCMQSNQLYDLVFINKARDQIYFLDSNNDLFSNINKSCDYISKGYIYDNILNYD